MSLNLSAAASTLSMSALVTAQSFVHPQHFTVAEGNSNLVGAFVGTPPTKHEQVHGAFPGMTVHGMRFRRDGSTSSSYPAVNVVVDIDIGPASTTPGTVQAACGSNFLGTPTRMVSFGQFPLPAQPADRIAFPFVYAFAFPSPYVFPGPGNLCWNIRLISAQPTNAIALDRQVGSSSIWATYSLGLGPACSGFILGHNAGVTNNNLTISYVVGGGPANELALLLLGTLRQNIQPPGGCPLMTSIALPLIPMPLTGSGGGGATIGFPVNPSLNGGTLLAQVVALTPTQSPGFVLSTANQTHLVAPFAGPCPMGWTDGTTARPNDGLIVEFY